MIQAGKSGFAKWHAYGRLMRIDKPIGTWLLMWPCWWALAMTAPSLPSAYLLALFFLGAFVMRSAGCIVNDLADRNLDAKVARTKDRPLASGALSVSDALSLLAFLLSSALFIVILLDNLLLFYLAFGTLIMIGIYPFMKRISWWPQLFLGLTFNLGALFAWIAINGELSLAAIALYIGCVFWTLGYDTIYGYQDIEDDLRIGVKSTSIRIREHSRLFLSACYITTILCWGAALWLTGSNMIAYGGIVACALHFFRQLHSLDIHQPDHCLKLFKSNSWVGLMFFCFLLADDLVIAPPL